MDLTTGALFAVIGVMASNQFVMRRRSYRPSPAVFWGLQAANGVAGVGCATFGLPGFERWPMISWVVGMLLFVHIIQNISLRSRWAADERREQREAEDEALLAKLRADDEARDARDHEAGRGD